VRIEAKREREMIGKGSQPVKLANMNDAREGQVLRMREGEDIGCADNMCLLQSRLTTTLYTQHEGIK